MNAKPLLKSFLKSLRKSCVKYRVGFDEILNELKDEENTKQKNGV